MKELENVKKCCLISLIKSENYGANLQGYALYHFIQDNFPNLEIVIIDLKRPGQKGYKSTINKNGSLMRFRLIVSNYILKLRSNRSTKLRIARFNDFIADMNFTQTYHNSTELFNNYPKCDIYVTGSDQVWCPNREFDLDPYLLSFVTHTASKISYAPSMSTKTLTVKQEEKFATALKDFKYLSVREFSDKGLLKAVLPEKSISVVVDPVLLFPSEYWEKMCEPVKKENYLLFYSIGPDEKLLSYAKKVCEQKGLELVYFRPQTNKTLCSKSYFSVNDAGPKELLGWIKSASIVMTNSYHGILMSLLLRTPFMYYAAQYSSRFETISSLFKLEKHQITDFGYIKKLEEIVISEDSKIAIKQAATESRNYLMSAIENCM